MEGVYSWVEGAVLHCLTLEISHFLVATEYYENSFPLNLIIFPPPPRIKSCIRLCYEHSGRIKVDFLPFKCILSGERGISKDNLFYLYFYVNFNCQSRQIKPKWSLVKRLRLYPVHPLVTPSRTARHV